VANKLHHKAQNASAAASRGMSAKPNLSYWLTCKAIIKELKTFKLFTEQQQSK